MGNNDRKGLNMHSARSIMDELLFFTFMKKSRHK